MLKHRINTEKIKKIYVKKLLTMKKTNKYDKKLTKLKALKLCDKYVVFCLFIYNLHSRVLQF